MVPAAIDEAFIDESLVLLDFEAKDGEAVIRALGARLLTRVI
jgi:hypothetical protein